MAVYLSRVGIPLGHLFPPRLDELPANLNGFLGGWAELSHGNDNGRDGRYLAFEEGDVLAVCHSVLGARSSPCRP